MTNIITVQGKCTIGFLPVEEGDSYFFILDNAIWYGTNKDQPILSFERLPPGTWEIINLASKITEEQAAELVEPFILPVLGENKVVAYEDYIDHSRYTNTALESFSSLMQANRIYTENPFGEKEPTRSNEWILLNAHTGIMETQTAFEKRLKQWQEAQSRTSKEWIILVKK